MSARLQKLDREDATTVLSLSAHRQAQWVKGWPVTLTLAMAEPLRLTWTPEPPCTVLDPETGEQVPCLKLLPDPSTRPATAAKLRLRLDKILYAAKAAVKNTYYEEELTRILEEVADDGESRWAIRQMRELLGEDDEPSELRLLARLIDFSDDIASARDRLAVAEKRELEALKERRQA